MFESKYKSFGRSGGSISSRKSLGIYNDSNTTVSNNSKNVSPTLLNQSNRLGVTFSGSYMKQSKLGYAHGSFVNIYIVYELKIRRISNPDFTVQNCLFGAIKVTKDVDTSNYKYSGYGICFDGESDITNGKNVIIFCYDMSFSSYSTNKKKIMFLVKTLFKE